MTHIVGKGKIGGCRQALRARPNPPGPSSSIGTGYIKEVGNHRFVNDCKNGGSLISAQARGTRTSWPG